MEKIRVVIVEDEFAIAEDISAQLQAAGYTVTAIFDSAEKGLELILKNPPDVILADIRLTGAMDGIELVKKLTKTVSLPIIYITANSDPATYNRARETRPHSFLVKPFSNANLLAAVDMALLNFSKDVGASSIERITALPSSEEIPFLVNQSLFIRTQGKYKKLHAAELLFVEAAGSYVHIQTSSERYTLSQNLASFHKKTPLPLLVRVHRSYIVNMGKVDSFEDSFVFIQNHKIPISDNYKADFMSKVHLL
jgi:DNA-binding LytR/AlgR family response regulator